MDYVELTVAVAPADAERAADILRTHTGAGAAIEMPFLQRSLELDAEIRDDAPAIVRSYLRSASPMDALVTALSDAGLRASLEQRRVAEEDWAEAWKEHFHVERFGRIVVVPSWRDHAPEPGDVVVTLDPGMAFGTGQHETTRMCLEALDCHVRAGMRILDVGCGSGILAIAAAKLGAGGVLAIDIDPDCVRITTENANANRVGSAVSARVATREQPLADVVDQRFDLILANIVASTVIDLAPSFVPALGVDGRLISSGIIADREHETVEALTASGLRVESVRAIGEWRCIEALH